MASLVGAMLSEEYGSAKKKKRKSMQPERKFLVDSRVEVRSLDDGLLGSWYSGTVVACSHQSRLVRYDSCLAEDGSGQCEEDVPVRYGSSSSCRGRIRPLPYSVALHPEELLYGLCVDVRHNDAWWEGVIFDHNTGAEKRAVFFPDMGDELAASIDNIRISFDWIESDWLRRGFWSFLKVIQDYEGQFHLPVSVKQIWYDLRQMEGFQEIKDWTYTDEAVWRKLVFDTILENLIISQSCILPPFESLGELANQQSAELESSEPQPPSDIDLVTATGGSDCLSIVPVDEPSGACLTDSDTQPSEISTYALALLPGEELGDFMPVIEYNESKIHIPVKPDAFSTNGTPVPISGRWEPVDLDPEPEYCPAAFASYLDNQESKSSRTAVKKHMAHLGWKAETTISGGTTRYRYISPEGGKPYQSLREVCRAQRRNTEIIPAPCSEVANRSLVTLPRCSISSPLTTARNAIVCRDPISSEDMIDDDCDQTPAHCPRAVLDYYALRLDQCQKRRAKKLRSRVRRELEAIGWKFIYRQKEQRRELVYISPREKQYFSLRMACKGCIKDCRTTGLIRRTMDRVNAGQEVKVKPYLSVGHGSSQKALVSVKTEDVESDGKLRNLNSDSTRHLKLKIKLPRSLVKANNEKKMSRLKHAARSSKRVQKILPGQFSHNPRTVLSWLVDDDILLPRAKVYCRGDNNRSRRKEGRVQRDGIKCCCCNELLTISGFASHSGGKSGSPAAIIFLEDGRSLLDCQVQILKKRNYLKEDPGDSVIQKAYADEESRENDNLCSVCHYGGDLILCDHCPSSFHQTCLGLKDVPDGEWFCPSCRCGLCGEGNLREDTEQFADVSLLNCNQCERKYHIACLRGIGEAELEDHQSGNWYCSRKCKQIHGGLLELEGKKISLGKDNLTLTLLKPVDYKRREDGDSNMGPAAESFVKLSIALAVMHECFESVKEPRSNRDLIEDVIFNRGSGLNRLNFHGFYTVLLEENDELITVATLRLHGEEVAEIPLVATRFHSRRRGMCRALMDALEKKLKELGVKRIVLPAAPSALNTWTGSFGFTEMTESERLQFVNHTFLNFQDTIMCRKNLFDTPPIESTVSIGNLLLTFPDHPKGSPDTELQDSCTVSEESQGKAMEGIEIVEQGTVDAVKDADGSGSTIHEESQLGRKQIFSERFPESSTTNIHSDEHASRDGRFFFKCYKRRRRSSTQNG